MTPTRKRRLIAVASLVVGIGIAAALALSAFKENMLYFYSPTDIAQDKVPPGAVFRVGGLVVAGSVVRSSDSLDMRFDVTDTAKTVNIRYTGILPDLFKEGQGIVALGRIGPDGVFQASEVLAKHDETYMPPEVHDSIEKAKRQSAQAKQQSANTLTP
ncbi:MAG: cytochrome c maturation protein CcmE [Gammaproteobacteria bacterium]|nr:MAG: cytochrome c maturation protein CcmE [Gammaproteobacteria bacterium]